MVHPALIIIPLVALIGGAIYRKQPNTYEDDKIPIEVSRMDFENQRRMEIENQRRTELENQRRLEIEKENLRSKCRNYANECTVRSKRYAEPYVSNKSVNNSSAANRFIRPRFKSWDRRIFFLTSCDELEQYYYRRYNTKHMDDWNHAVEGVTYAGEFEMGQGYPVIVHAVIYPFHLERPRNTFTGLDEQMQYMNQWADDEKGHIVASQLGGPATWWNLAPQTSRVNRNVGGSSGWINNENCMRKYLQNNCGHIEYTVMLNYDRTSLRPTAFKTCTRFRDENNSLVKFEYFNYDNTY